MNEDTKREVANILKQGWYRKGTTLGDGGWGKIPDWEKYLFFTETADIEDVVYAKDDFTAEKAFRSLYHLDMIEKAQEWDIFHVITEYRLVATTNKGE